MAKELIPSNVALPAHLANRLNQPSQLGAAVTAGISSGVAVPRISIKGSRFRIVEDGAELVLNTLETDVIIVGANPHLTKMWYAKKWNPDDEPGAPDCFSHNGIRPDVEAENPQATLCASCPKNQWGSSLADNGQKLKACSDSKRLAVVSASDPEGTVYLLSVTPAALKGLNQYHRELAQKGIPAEVVITKLGFDSAASFPKLTFRFGGFIPEHHQPIIDALIGSDQVHMITGEDKAVSLDPAPVSKPTLVRPAAPQTIDAEYSEVPPPAPPPVAPPAPPPAPAPTAAKGFAAQAAAAPAQAPAPKGFAAQATPATPMSSAVLSDRIKGLVDSLDDDDA